MGSRRRLGYDPQLVSPLAGGGFAVESVVEKRTINLVTPALREPGATDRVEMPTSKIVP